MSLQLHLTVVVVNAKVGYVSDITEMNPDFDWLRREGMSQLLYVTVVCVQVITLLYVTVHVSTR